MTLLVRLFFLHGMYTIYLMKNVKLFCIRLSVNPRSLLPLQSQKLSPVRRVRIWMGDCMKASTSFSFSFILIRFIYLFKFIFLAQRMEKQKKESK